MRSPFRPASLLLPIFALLALGIVVPFDAGGDASQPIPAHRLSARQAQNRPQTFAAGKQTVAHRPVKRRGLPIRLRQIAVQRAVDQLLASDEIVFEIHVRNGC